MSFPEWRETKEKVAMAEKVGRIKAFEFMRDTACVHIDEREVIAWCQVYKLINPEDKDFNDFLEKVAIPSLTKVGRSRWFRDQLTDLALALAMRKRGTQTEDTKDILEAPVE